MTTKRKNNWRVSQEHARRKSALLTLLENTELRPQDRLNAEAMLQSLDSNREAYKAGQTALREVDRLNTEVERLTAELNARDTQLAEAHAEIERLKNDLHEALELIEVPNA